MTPTALRKMSTIRIRICIGIKIESQIRMQICIKTMPIQNPQHSFSGEYGGQLASKIWELYLVAVELMVD